ncbi:MAG: hypothetical protein KAQ81_07040, partial [Deltaproteobacteria bacterium]|nr:hypothetical protein [Deltaproteobacteria bacterium]
SYYKFWCHDPIALYVFSALRADKMLDVKFWILDTRCWILDIIFILFLSSIQDRLNFDIISYDQ